MTVVPPQAWRIVGERLTDDEAFIPMTPRDLEVFLKRQAGPTDEERAVMLTKSEQREADRVAEMKSLRERHEYLTRFSAAPVITTLLEQHAPHVDEGWDRRLYLVCRACPESHDAEYGDSHQSWPCPTWQTISDATP